MFEEADLMTKPLSITMHNETIHLETNRSDIAASLIRGIVGATPVVGPIVAEALSMTIPNQKIDRIVAFLRILEDKLKYVEQDLLKEASKSEEFNDLLEDGL